MNPGDDIRLRPRLPGARRLSERLRELTPARLLVGRSGEAYTTATQLQLRADHAAARDAVWRELQFPHDLGPDFVERWKLFEVCTHARTKSEYLLQPNRGRELGKSAEAEITRHCASGADLQIVIGDGLSAGAIAAQVPPLLPLLVAEAERRGWRWGQPFVVRHCRVGVINGVGELLRPRVVVLLIGERPGMSSAESLSAYMAYEPRRGHSDADRNLISNIHARGLLPGEASVRIVSLAAEFMRLKCSGTTVKEPGEVK
jgi:ethanolamine ammonia-lyase small subunit